MVKQPQPKRPRARPLASAPTPQAKPKTPPAPAPGQPMAYVPDCSCQGGRGMTAKLAAQSQDRRRAKALGAVRQLLAYIGDHPDRPGLRETPERVLKAWEQSWGAGYHAAPPVLKCFPEKGVDYTQMVVVKGISFWSTCEHHMAPFFGTADIAYVPSPSIGVLGLSKLARVLDYFSRRLQVQERLTAQVADHLADGISPDVGVVLRATHFCMVSRGVQRPGAVTVTSALRGEFLTDASVKAEFLRLTSKED